ncbi:MAG: zf-HC2 domain-containing protein [Acidobacteriia bacterium]|nr:zf-HC2 domain-containing protein [Terriglobia bacterium]
MLTCKEFLGWLNEYLDETAAAEIRSLVESHISTCPNCWVIHDTTKKTLQVYKGMEPQLLPPEIHNRILSLLEKAALEKRAAQSD